MRSKNAAAVAMPLNNTNSGYIKAFGVGWTVNPRSWWGYAETSMVREQTKKREDAKSGGHRWLNIVLIVMTTFISFSNAISILPVLRLLLYYHIPEVLLFWRVCLLRVLAAINRLAGGSIFGQKTVSASAGLRRIENAQCGRWRNRGGAWRWTAWNGE